MCQILRRLEFRVEKDGAFLKVTAPRWREDIEVGEPDLAEEIIRFIKRKAKTLLVPYVITCAAVVLLAGAAEAFRGGDAAAAVCVRKPCM